MNIFKKKKELEDRLKQILDGIRIDYETADILAAELDKVNLEILENDLKETDPAYLLKIELIENAKNFE